MSQIENKMDDFAPFGGTARTEYQEDELAIPHRRLHRGHQCAG